MLADSILEEVYSAKFLGILLDRGLTWDVTYTGMGLEAEITTELEDTELEARLKRFLVSKAFYSLDKFLAFNWETAQFDD
ncbi:hypothetical protein J6590_040229 [Homalodisca vitripennis]|nr:hypothetical protein J6590_040229 [Homalodisca vitripennis]